MTTVLEWKPGPGGPIWAHIFGRDTPMDIRVGEDLKRRLSRWNAGYRADRLPLEGNGDTTWMREGIGLLAEVRRAVGARCQVVAVDPWWPDEPTGGVREPRRPLPKPVGGSGERTRLIDGDPSADGGN